MKSHAIHPLAAWLAAGPRNVPSGSHFACLRAPEERQALDTIAEHMKGKSCSLIAWDALNGFRRLGKGGAASPIGKSSGVLDFRFALNRVAGMRANSLPEAGEAVFVFLDGHQYLDAGKGPSGFLLAVAKALGKRAGSARSGYPPRACILMLPWEQEAMPAWTAPFPTFELPLPELDQLREEILARIRSRSLAFPEASATEDKERFGIPGCDEKTYRDRIVTRMALYGRGLGLHAFRMRLGALAAASPLLGPDRFVEMQSWQIGSGVAGALACAPQVDSDLAGMAVFKSWLAAHRDGIGQGMRGIAICGAPGTGKSRLIQVLAREMQAVLLRLDLQTVLDGRRADPQVFLARLLERAKDFTPAVLWVDGWDGARGLVAEARDRGVPDGVLRVLADWLAHPHPGLFVAATLRDFRSLRLRDRSWFKEPRFDARFFLDLPGAETRSAIFFQYIRSYRELLFPILPDASRIARGLGLPPPRKQGRNGLGGICALLGHERISGSLAGTGIKDAVNRAGREIIRKIRTREDQPQLRWESVFAAASEPGTGNGYGSGSRDRKGLNALRKAAAAEGWIRVD